MIRKGRGNARVGPRAGKCVALRVLPTPTHAAAVAATSPWATLSYDEALIPCLLASLGATRPVEASTPFPHHATQYPGSPRKRQSVPRARLRSTTPASLRSLSSQNLRPTATRLTSDTTPTASQYRGPRRSSRNAWTSSTRPSLRISNPSSIPTRAPPTPTPIPSWQAPQSQIKISSFLDLKPCAPTITALSTKMGPQAASRRPCSYPHRLPLSPPSPGVLSPRSPMPATMAHKASSSLSQPANAPTSTLLFASSSHAS